MQRRADLHRQRGAVSLMAAVLIATVAIGALVSIDVGFVFYSQRQLQKSVDLAALSGAQQLKRADDLPTTTANVMASVAAAASQNGYPDAVSPGCADAAAGAADGMRTCLGVWDPADAVNGDGVRHFNPGYDAATLSPNAVRVQGTLTVPLLFVLPGGTSRQLHAEAIAAASPPVASFSLGSGVLNVSTANGILSLLLGNTVNLSAADWSGLVGANVTLDQLRLQANAGTVNQLLDTTLSIQDFYALVLTAADKRSLLGVALGSPATQLGLNGIGTTLTLRRMLDLGVLTPAASSAAEVGLNVASLLTTAAYVARGTSAVSLDGLNLNLGIASATGSLYIIEPPKVAVGPARQLPDGSWKTTASTGQIGLKLSLAASVGVGALANAALNVPLWLQVGTARGDLTQLQCAATPAQRTATINVSTHIAQACLAGTGTSCAPNGVPVNLVSVTLLGGALVSTSIASLPVPVQTSDAGGGNDIVLSPGGYARTSGSNPLKSAVSNLLAALNPTFSIKLPALDLASVNAGDVLGLFLKPVADLLDEVVIRLLNTLGISIANADVWLNGVDCNNAELVY